MKINSNVPQAIDSAIQSDTKITTRSPAVENTTTLQESDAIKLSQQKAATEAKGFSNLNASLLQASLSNVETARMGAIKTAASELLPSMPTLLSKSGNDPDKFTDSIRTELKSNDYAVLGSMNGQDIEAIAFLVLMQSAKSAQEDLKAIMEKVKDINQSKSEMRDMMNQLNKEAYVQQEGQSVSKKDDDD